MGGNGVLTCYGFEIWFARKSATTDAELVNKARSKKVAVCIDRGPQVSIVCLMSRHKYVSRTISVCTLECVVH